jgi:hypothetical protein
MYCMDTMQTNLFSDIIEINLMELIVSYNSCIDSNNNDQIIAKVSESVTSANNKNYTPNLQSYIAQLQKRYMIINQIQTIEIINEFITGNKQNDLCVYDTIITCNLINSESKIIAYDMILKKYYNNLCEFSNFSNYVPIDGKFLLHVVLDIINEYNNGHISDINISSFFFDNNISATRLLLKINEPSITEFICKAMTNYHSADFSDNLAKTMASYPVETLEAYTSYCKKNNICIDIKLLELVLLKVLSSDVYMVAEYANNYVIKIKTIAEIVGNNIINKYAIQLADFCINCPFIYKQIVECNLFEPSITDLYKIIGTGGSDLIIYDDVNAKNSILFLIKYYDYDVFNFNVQQKKTLYTLISNLEDLEQILPYFYEDDIFYDCPKYFLYSQNQYYFKQIILHPDIDKIKYLYNNFDLLFIAYDIFANYLIQMIETYAISQTEIEKKVLSIINNIKDIEFSYTSIILVINVLEQNGFTINNKETILVSLSFGLIKCNPTKVFEHNKYYCCINDSNQLFYHDTTLNKKFLIAQISDTNTVSVYPLLAISSVIYGNRRFIKYCADKFKLYTDLPVDIDIFYLG